MSYMTVETTNLIGCVCFSLQHTEDIQNGAIVGKGDLVEGETSIYTAVEAKDEKTGFYLVANPAWSYDDSSVTCQNEENFINVKGVPFRAYELKKDKKFKIANLPSETKFNKGDYIKYNFSEGKYETGTEADGFKVVAVEDVGFPYCVGSYGIKNDKWGYTVDTTNTKYTVEVVSLPSGSGE